MTTFRIILRRTRTLLWTALSIVIILAAILVGVGKLLMPYSERYQPQLEAWLSREFGRPVVVESFIGEWNAFGPRLKLRGMRLQSPGDGSSEVAIEEAALDLKPLNALLPGKAWYNFLVIGADFSLVQGDDGGFELSGFGAGGPDGPAGQAGLRNLVGIAELILEDSNLEYTHPGRGIRLKLTGINARVQLDDESVSLTLDADLFDQEVNRIFGELGATALLEFSTEGRLATARWHVSLHDLMLDPLRGRLPASRFLPQQGLVNGEFWGDWLAGQPVSVRGVADVRNGRLEHGEDLLFVEHANARLAWSYSGKADWRLDFHELRFDDGVIPWSAPNIALARNVGEDLGLWLSADALPLEVSLQLARDIMSLYGTPWPDFLPESVAGSVSEFDLMLDSRWRLRLARGRARDAGVQAWGRWPSVSGIDADFALNRGEGGIDLHARALAIDWPRMFAGPLRFSLPYCRAELDLRSGWQLGLHDCGLINEDLALNGDLLITGNIGRPAVDANMVVSRADLARIAPYWPQGIMSPRVVAWLRRGLLEGEIDEGRFQIFGDMDNWPFRAGQGRFEAVARVSGAGLEYAPGWPVARGVDAKLQFVGPSMSIVAQAGEVGDVAVQQATAEIADFKQAMLRVSYESESELPALIRFLRGSPILAASDYALDRFKFAGPASTQGTLAVPLGRTPGRLMVDGHARVRGGSFTDLLSGFALQRISGDLRYDQEGLRGEGLQARYRDQPALLDVRADPDSAERFRATLGGRFDVDDVLPDFLRDETVFARIEGASEWRASVVVPGPRGAPDAAPQLIVESQLEGVAVRLPQPLAKPAEAIWPLTLRYPLSGATRLLELDLADRAAFRLETRVDAAAGDSPLGTALRAAVGLGHSAVSLPPAGMVRVEGRADSLDLDGWTGLTINRTREGGGLGGLALDRCVLEAGRMRFLDREFSEVAMRLAVNPGDMRAEFSSEAIDGHVLFTPGQRGGSLTAEFERLALGKPVAGGVEMRSNPAELPELHLYARSFRYAGIEMGETRVEAYPTPDGFHFEKVESESDSLTLRASGDWLMLEDGPRSDFRILVTTESLGRFLESVGISSSLAGGQTVLRFNAWWPGPPAAFALSRLNGEVEFSVSRGQITNASAGSGRLLGLLSLQALPRRLSLDFRDVFDAGFDFEEAHGTFQMENGTASTDDVELSSSAAKISLSGSTDLVAQRYDQLLTVQPGVGNTLPVIGAIAGGPGGAAAGLALQGLLHDQLGEATQVQYTITGSWEEPSIEPVLKDAAGSEPGADGP